MHTDPIIRNFALRFPQDADPGLMRACVEAWGRRFANHFVGAGYFPTAPEIETYPGADPRGGVLRCYAFYLRADSQLWDQITGARTLTADEPVLGCQMAYRDGRAGAAGITN